MAAVAIVGGPDSEAVLGPAPEDGCGASRDLAEQFLVAGSGPEVTGQSVQ
jgi:hypothetical protein